MAAECKPTLLLGASSSIVLEKNNLMRQPDTNDFDAVLHCVIRVEGVSKLLYRDYEYTIGSMDVIDITPDIQFHMVETIMDKETGITKKITMRIYSETKSIADLRAWIKSCRVEYEASRSNKLGDDLYYFDQTVTDDVNQAKALSFTREKFSTTRRLSNVFFEEKLEVQSRVELFQNHPEWYAKRGIPHTLGFMFTGEPGCGKTSTIKAIANETKRHIVNIRLSDIRTNTQLRNLFYNPVLQVTNPDTLLIERVNVPINRRLYVAEDIDAVSDLIKRREYRPVETKATATSAPPAKRATPAWTSGEDGDEELAAYFAGAIDEEKAEMVAEQKQEEARDRLTFDNLLNTLDGSLETPGRIICITTNHPDIIDPALIRPGRIDAIINFKLASRAVIRDMFNIFYEPTTPFAESLFAEIPERVISPAKLNQILFRNLLSYAAAIAELLVKK